MPFLDHGLQTREFVETHCSTNFIRFFQTETRKNWRPFHSEKYSEGLEHGSFLVMKGRFAGKLRASDPQVGTADETAYPFNF